MGTLQPSSLNFDPNGVQTSGEYADAGDGTSRWFQWKRTANGGDVAQGATTNAAVTDPSSAGTVVSLLKGLLTFLRVSAAGVGKAEDAAHASGDTGVMPLAVRRDTAAASSGTTGDYEPLQTDSSGRLRTLAKRDPTDALLIDHPAALEASTVVKASPGTLHSIVGTVDSGVDGYIQVHDATSLPSNGAVPEMSFFVNGAAASQGVNIPLPGHVCGTGIVVAWSTTLGTLTIGTSKLFVTCHYE